MGLGVRFWVRARGRRGLLGLAVRQLRREDRGRGQAGVSAADVRQRRADPARISARPISQRRAAAAPAWKCGGPGAFAGYDLPGHLLSEFHGVVRAVCPQRQSAVHPGDGRLDAGSGNAVYAAAQYGAIGFGPFSIENVSDEKARLIASCYGVLSGMSELILKAQQDGTSHRAVAPGGL